MNTTSSPRLCFDLNEDPWINVLLADGTTVVLGLRETLQRANEIVRLSESSLLTEVALLRFLIALISDGLREQVPSEDHWRPFWERCRDGLPEETVSDILKPLRDDADVLSPDQRAFFDTAKVRSVKRWDDPKARQPASRLLPEIPVGTNLAHFVHSSDDESPLCIGCILKGRILDAAFARGGLGPSVSRNLLATIGGKEPRYVCMMARTLLQTLLLNLVVGDPGPPSWRSIHRRSDGPPGPLARMSWRPRLLSLCADSHTSAPCIHCGDRSRPRLRKFVMVDTYNHTGSPFGSKTDVDCWKKSPDDPHLLAPGDQRIRLGDNSREWALRALVRVLSSESKTFANGILCRAKVATGPLTLTVVSSAGNQAKIDDAPADVLEMPAELLARPMADLAKIGQAMQVIFDKSARLRRATATSADAKALLKSLAASADPHSTLTEWLTFPQHKAAEIDAVSESTVVDPESTAARRLILRLEQLSRVQLAAIRSSDAAARQASFEAVWHGCSLPGGINRHSIREALANVAPLYAVFRTHHRIDDRPDSILRALRARLAAEGQADPGRSRPRPIRRLIERLLTPGTAPRDVLLGRLVEAVVTPDRRWRAGGIDFADLLRQLVLWSDRVAPTAAKWRCLLD